MKEFCNEAYYMIFSTLANRTRLAIIDVLKDCHKNLSEISKALEQDETIIAQNLQSLEKCVLVLPHSSGKDKCYSLNREIIEPPSDLLSFHADKYCPGFKECVPAEKLREYMKAEAAKTTYIGHE